MKCKAYVPRPNSGGKRGAEAVKKQRVSQLRNRYWQADFIGWPALAESFRRDLRAMGVEP